MTDKDRFLQKVSLNGKCWIWNGSIMPTGYGGFWFDGKWKRAHRIAAILFKGPIPSGLDVCHSCDNRRCVNPDHLFFGTRSVNMLDAVAKQRHKSPFKQKLTNSQVIEIRSLRGRESQYSIAARMGVKQCTVSDIQRGKRRANA